MTTFAEHMADQAALTALCESGECDHPECQKQTEENDWPTTGDVSDVLEKRIQTLFLRLMDGADMTNSHRGARALGSLIPTYQDTPATCLRDAISDLYHAADLLGIDFDEERRVAYDNYQAEVHEEGPAPNILDGWTPSNGGRQ